MADNSILKLLDTNLRINDFHKPENEAKEQVFDIDDETLNDKGLF